MSNNEAVAFFRFLARTLPKKFRERFAEEMVEVFTNQLTKKPYTFRQQIFIHRTLLNLAWLSLKQNLNYLIGIGLAIAGIFMLASFNSFWVDTRAYYFQPMTQDVIIAWVVGTFGLLFILNGLAVVLATKWVRKSWVSMIVAAVVIAGFYVYSFATLIREDRKFHFPIVASDYLSFVLATLLPLLATVLISHYLQWREQAVS